MHKMKLAFVFLSLLCTTSWAQNINFEQVPPPPPASPIIPDFANVRFSSVAFADVDNDGDQDMLITGQIGVNLGSQPVTKLYLQNASGNYVEAIGTPFVDVEFSSVAFADVDNDGDQDVLITGSASTRVAKLYTNDGSGNFTEVMGTPFNGVSQSSVAFADVDGDNDLDLLITGRTVSGRIANLYTNDGTGNFTLASNTPFEGVSLSSIAFADVDGDNDQDILITGQNVASQSVSKLYTNDGSGNFTEMMGTPFDDIRSSSIAFADVDNDNDQDVVLTGRNASNQDIAKLYTNNGSGSFTEVTGTPFDGVVNSSIAFADVDNDNDQDLLITGISSSGNSAKLYTNNGSGTFTEVTNTSLFGVSSSSVAFADIDNDNDQDLLITGAGGSSLQIATKLYTNDGAGNFTEITGTPFDPVGYSSVAFADVDGDNDQDVLITGFGSVSQTASKLYINDGSGGYSEATGSSFEGVLYSSVAFADVDGDNDQDVLISGLNANSQPVTKLYTNDGSGNFTEVTGTPFDGVFYSSVAFADVDNDNDQDLLLTGATTTGAISKLYNNDGSGNFTENVGVPFSLVGTSSVVFFDMDSDNDLDVLISGSGISGVVTKLYRNFASGAFTEVTSAPFTGVYASSVAHADIDNDGDQDVLITGEDASGNSITKLYRNDDGLGDFVEIANTPFDSVAYSSVAFADVDNDGDQDVLITGEDNAGDYITKLYSNDGSGVFTEVTGLPFEAVAWSSIAFADVDNDNIQDVLITGLQSTGYTADLYRGVSCSLTASASVSGATLTANTSGATYQWLDCDNGNAPISGATSQSFTATANGNYAVLVTTSNGCSDTSACVSVNSVFTAEQVFETTPIAYPNPTKGSFILDMGAIYPELTVIVRNALGQEIIQQNALSVDRLNLTISGAPGIYFIELRNGDKNTVLKILKQ